MMALSVYFDAWWHEAIGRESFWIPPHLGIYTGLFVSIAGFLILHQLHQGKVPRELRLYLGGIIGIVVAGYADELWHQKFEVEKVGTLESIWSPTHVSALAAGAVASLGIILYLHAQIRTTHGSDARLGWLLTAEFGVLVSIITLLMLPIGPESPFRLIGVWGASLVALVILALRFLGSGLSEKPWAFSVITLFNWSGNALLLSNHASLLLLLAFLTVGLVPPFIADLIVQRGRRLKNIRTAYTFAGVVWGVLFGAFFYPLSNGLSFNAGSNSLDVASLVLAGFTSAAASILVGFIVGSKFQQAMLARTLVFEEAHVQAGGMS